MKPTMPLFIPTQANFYWNAFRLFVEITPTSQQLAMEKHY